MRIDNTLNRAPDSALKNSPEALPRRHGEPTVKATSLAYLVFERPDLDRAERFLIDLGLKTCGQHGETLFLRAADRAPYCYRIHKAAEPRFLGFGLTVASREDLEQLAKLPGASGIVQVNYPGGGECVSLTDPSGFLIEAVYNQAEISESLIREPLALNSPGNTVRINGTQRPTPESASIVKLGHIVLEVADYQATTSWYTQHFGFIPSDVQVLPDGSPAVTFFRLDLGDTAADHHTLAVAQGFKAAYSHSAYEVIDLDAIGMGSQVLRKHGWKHAWGIGRHILGSQIFDYWCDPWGDKHERYCDGDLFTAAQPTGVHPVSREAMAQWGPSMPASFTRPKLTPAAIAALWHNLRRSPDLSLRKLVTLVRLFG